MSPFQETELHKETRDLIEAQIPDVELKRRLFKWLEVDQNIPSLKELHSLVERNDEGLRDRFLPSLSFGTAGIRASMGCGFNRINFVTVCQIAQGFCMYLRTTHGPERCANKGVVIGYDGRHNSKKFAHLVAGVMLAKKVKVYMFGKLVATPLVSYATKALQCLAGIVITASHNPRTDNGMKFFTERGTQLMPPLDEEVGKCISENQSRWDEVYQLVDQTSGLLLDIGRITNPFDTIFEKYLIETTAQLCRRHATTKKSELKVAYTAMHGVGDPFVRDLVKRFGFNNLHTVEEQRLPDPDFATVPFPNPEEKGAMKMAMDTADRVEASIAIANDPDADRFAACEKRKDGSWIVFTGDELGIIFADYRLQTMKEFDNIPANKILFVCSVVSSRMLQKFAATEGCRYEETLTGFKWVSNRTLELEKEEDLKPALFYEEALGYALTTLSPDKDGVSAAAVFIEMACHLYSKKKTVADRLQEIREKYGFFVSMNSYYLSYFPEETKAVFAELRNKGKYKTSIGEFKIKRIRDVTRKYDNGEPSDECTLPQTPSSEMITLYFENGAVVTLRTSGTEPKIKYYSELSGSSIKDASAKLKKVVDAVILHVYQPEKHRLRPAPT